MVARILKMQFAMTSFSANLTLNELKSMGIRLIFKINFIFNVVRFHQFY